MICPMLINFNRFYCEKRLDLVEKKCTCKFRGTVNVFEIYIKRHILLNHELFDVAGNDISIKQKAEKQEQI